MRPWTWEGLAAATLQRQFPRVRGTGRAAVVELVRRVGPIQSQAARAPFLCLAARLPGAGRDAVTSAHVSDALVRSTSLRGTVHTSTREQHAALAAVAIRAQAALWRRVLRVGQEPLEAFWSELERLTEDGWLTNEAIEPQMRAWMEDHGLDDSVVTEGTGPGRFVFRGHPAMLRRPVKGAWEGQGEVVYRAARHQTGEQPIDPQQALVRLVRSHVGASGPVTRRDLAWWSGDGLRNVDAAIETLGDELVSRPGPNGLAYLDLAERTGRSGWDPGVRLLPEYDALLLAYDPKARDRFADADAVSYTWNRRNGVHSPTLLVDGRIRGRWHLERKGGSATVAAEMFPGERLLDADDLTDAAAAIAAVLDIPVTDVTITHCR